MILCHDVHSNELATAQVAGWELLWEQGLIRYKNGLRGGSNLIRGSDIRGVELEIAASSPNSFYGDLGPSNYRTYTLGQLDELSFTVFCSNFRLYMNYFVLPTRMRHVLKASPEGYEFQALWYVLLERLLSNDHEGKSTRVLIPIQRRRV
jgi:hypothetical protein